MFPFFNKYPGTDLHEIDLAYILKLAANLEENNEILLKWKSEHEEEYEELLNKVNGLVENLVDVIVPWDSSAAYGIYSIVEYQGVNYIAVQDVPIGVMITNTEYWVPANTAIEQINAIGVTTSEINENVQDIENSLREYLEVEPLNVITLGVKNDGSEDCSDILNQYGATHSLYFPVGEYLIENAVTFTHSIIGAVGVNDTGHCTKFNTKASITLKAGEVLTIECRNIMIDANNITDPAVIATSERWGFVKIADCTIKRAKTGILLNPTGSRSRFAEITNVRLFGPETDDTLLGSVGIDIRSGAVDSHITDVEIMYYQVGIKSVAGGLRLIGAHIYTNTASITSENKNTYYRNTICIDQTGNIYASDIYIDGGLQAYVQRSGMAEIANAFYWNDGGFADVANNDESIFTTRGTARIDVTSLIAGGDGRNIFIIADPNNTVIGTLKVLFSDLSDIDQIAKYRKYLTLTGMLVKMQVQNIAFSKYTEIARILGIGNGNAVVRITTGSIYADILIRFGNTGSISEIKYITNPNNMVTYYRVAGPWVILYPGITSGATIQTSCTMLSVTNRNNGPFAVDSYPNFVPDTQDDTSNLTQIQ